MAVYFHPTSTGSFGADGTNATTIPGLERMTFDQSRKRLYALTNTPKIYAFDAPTVGTHTPVTGFPINVADPGFESGLTVDSGTGNIFFASTQTGLYGFDSGGVALPGPFPVHNQGEVNCGVSVDSQGHVWVSDKISEKLKEYDQSGNPIGTPINAPTNNGPCQVAFDTSNDDVYVAGFGAGMFRYTAASGYKEKIRIYDNEFTGAASQSTAPTTSFTRPASSATG